MAAAPGLLLWLLLLGPPWRVRGQARADASRRFAEHKVCADEECSMLMYRGEALEDFIGPDCRFVSFKKGDAVYVYYKLAGRPPEVWAGSVGRIFGYFPKDLIQVVHEYTKEELQVPTDETDFVCFDGGRDDFDNYNVEELLGFLELHNSATEESEKAIEETQYEEDTPPEVLEESDLELEPVEVNSEESESVASENTKELKERSGAQKNHPHVSSPADHAQGDPSSFEPFEEMLQDKLKVPESENNKTSNGSQVSNEQQTIDAYKLLKKEMTLDLKTKFGSTADALVSDDETTRLVTSLEDDFDEELDAEYHIVGKDEEENEDNFDELPLLTFAHGGEDVKTPVKSGVEKYSAESEQSSNEEDKVEAPHVTSMDLGSSESQEGKEGDDAFIPESKWRKPRSAADYIDPKKAEDGLLPTANDVGTKTDNDEDLEIHIAGKGRGAKEPKPGLAQAEMGPEEEKQEGMTTHGSTHSGDLGSLTSTGKGKEMLESAFDNKEDDLKGAAIHISKGMLHEEKPGEQISEGGSEREPLPQATGGQVNEEKPDQESVGIAAPSGGGQHNASRDRVEDVHALAGLKPHTPSVEHPKEEFREERLLKTQNQPRPSPLDGVGLPGELKEEGPIWGRNLSWPQGGEVAAAHSKQMDEKGRLAEEEVREDSSAEELAPQQPKAGSQEVEPTGRPGSPEVPGVHTEKPEAEDDHSPEELLEDENALSAKQAKEKSPGIQGRWLDVNLQSPSRAPLGVVNTDAEMEGNKEEASTILEIERKGETFGKEVEPGGRGREAGSGVVETESPLAGAKAQMASGGSDSPDKKNRTPGLGEMFQNQDSDYFKEDSAEKSAQKPGVEELSEEDQDFERPADTQSQGPAPEEQEGGPLHGTPPTVVRPMRSDYVKDLPIIGSFFKEQQSLQRFQKYFDVHELEAMFHEMSLKLKLAQQESLPYNVEKVLDKVFRASESQILSTAEKMLDTRVAENRDLGMMESNIFEEAAVLDDIQDLIYFVRYRHSTMEETAPLATGQPPQEGWGGTLEEDSFPQDHTEDNFPQDHTEDLQIQILKEPSQLDQPVVGDMGASEVSQQPNTEKDGDPGKLVATLPDDVQPGPDFYGLPWKPVLLTAFLGIGSFAVFFWKTVLVVIRVSSLMGYHSEISSDSPIKESKKHVQETKKQNIILSDEAIKFKDKIKKLEETNEILDDTAKNLRVMLESEREQNAKNQDLILENKKSIEKLKDVISVNASEFSEVQIALNEAKLSEEKVKSECHRVQEENARLKKKKEQLQQEIKDWSKSHAELSEQIKSFETSQKNLEVALTHKDDNINALTNCITQLNRLDCESESEDQSKGGSELDELANGEVGGDRSEKMKNQIKQMMDISRTQTAISVVEEDLKLLQIKLRASMSTKCNLEDQIKKLEDDRDSLQSAKAGLEDECKTLRQKVEILNELYQQKEMALQKKLSQEEYERQEREQRLSAADEKALLAAEEVKTYKRRIEEMEDELQKTERSFKNQIATHEKKAHDNWLKARAAERAIAEEKREAANLRHKLLELTQKMAMLQEEPVIVKPRPGRPSAQNPPWRGPLSQNGSFGPSPVSGGECSPPPTADLPTRPLSATLNRREMPRGEFGEHPHFTWQQSLRTVTTSVLQVPMAAKGPPPFPGVPLMGSPVGGPLPPPIRYGPPPQLCGPFGPRPLPPPFGPALRPPLGLREYAPGIPPGKRDLSLDPREFLPGHAPFRPLGSFGPREYFIPGTRLPPPAHGPQDYPPPPAARDLLPSGSRDEPPPASQGSSQDCSQALKQSP
uniref:Transport and Golgi organization protein 1 homolog n=1 Tax=Canis lupus dingo TaxID=286419 RepID=A0A8C0JQ67_CANLU